MRTPKSSPYSNSQQLSSTTLGAPHVYSEGTLIQMKPQKERGWYQEETKVNNKQTLGATETVR